VVTNPSAEQWPTQSLSEELYCERGEMENRIKVQSSLFATRVSAETICANQVASTFRRWRTCGCTDCGGWVCRGRSRRGRR